MKLEGVARHVWITRRMLLLDDESAGKVGILIARRQAVAELAGYDRDDEMPPKLPERRDTRGAAVARRMYEIAAETDCSLRDARRRAEAEVSR